MDVFTKNIGEIFDHRYKILRTIGVGGMAIVYEAIDIATGKHVAIKTLKDSISDDPQALRRFINESKAVAMLNHPNIVKILDVSVKTEHKFIVMEYIEGITLREYMNRKGPLGWREALAFITQILLALDHAHLKGVIHRDIKPQNILVMDGGVIKVADFGIAKIPDAQTVTMIDHAVGTIYYISPEQAKGKKIDSRSDLYSLGIMLYEMVTGKLPFLAENAYGIMMKHISDAPTPPTALCPNLPLGIEQIINMAIEKNPDNRYQSASQIIRHIYRIQGNPTVLFHNPRPVPRTPTAEVAIGRTEETEDPYETPKPPVRSDEPTQRPRRRTPKAPMQPQGHRPVGNGHPPRRPAPGNTHMERPEHSDVLPRKRRAPEYVPFSVVIVICIAFLVLAIVGFALLFAMLKSDVPQNVTIMLPDMTETGRKLSTTLWKTLQDTELHL